MHFYDAKGNKFGMNCALDEPYEKKGKAWYPFPDQRPKRCNSLCDGNRCGQAQGHRGTCAPLRPKGVYYLGEVDPDLQD